VWRTWGSPGTTFSEPKDNEKLWNQARTHNSYVKTLIDTNEISRKEAGKVPSSISYIDFGQAMLPRLYPKEKRIQGDMASHYGLEARLAFVQMLMNHLIERDRQKRLMISPWLKDVTNNHGYNDSENFMTMPRPIEHLKPEEIEAIKNAEASFCDDCVWFTGISCRDRVEYILNGKNPMKMLDSLVSAMKVPACNISSDTSV
jgi:hypothetical protein